MTYVLCVAYILGNYRSSWIIMVLYGLYYLHACCTLDQTCTRTLSRTRDYMNCIYMYIHRHMWSTCVLAVGTCYAFMYIYTYYTP